VTKGVRKFEDTTAETTVREIDDDQSFVEDGRQFVDIPAEAGASYRWKFMIVTFVSTSAVAPENECIRLVYSTNRRDRPTGLPDAFVLLYDGVVHCLPHNRTFDEPIRLSFLLPDWINLRQIRAMYSNTDVGDATCWTMLDKPRHSPTSADWQNGESRPDENQVLLLADSRQLQLVLRRFCIFAVVVDGREQPTQNISVDAFLKIAVNNLRYTVNIRVVVGCNTDSCVSACTTS